MNWQRRAVLLAFACVLGTLVGIGTARSQISPCKFFPGAGYGTTDMRGCYDAADCPFSGCCLRYMCVGHPPACGANCGEVCVLTDTCETITSCYNDCT